MNRTYKCPKCGIFEYYMKGTDILTKCPDCGTMIKQKLGLNFRLIGPGFYATDNKENV